jgi:hypothetical protein
MEAAILLNEETEKLTLKCNSKLQSATEAKILLKIY